MIIVNGALPFIKSASDNVRLPNVFIDGLSRFSARYVTAMTIMSDAIKDILVAITTVRTMEII